MNESIREDLIGYLLGALDIDDRRRVEQALEDNPTLRHQLELLDAHLHALRGEDVEWDPPANLAGRTCDAVKEVERNRKVTVAANEHAGKTSRWSMIDLFVAAGICVAVATLFFPAIANSRFNSQITLCQDNLRELGVALGLYSEAHGGEFPAIPQEGNDAVAGSYAPKLMENELIMDPAVFVCPSSRLAEQEDPWRVPSRREIELARGREVVIIQQTMGGSYAYTLGYADGHYRPTQNLARAHFVIMADSPSRQFASRKSSNHAGRGQNVLFEDFHVEYVVDCSGSGCDPFYENRNGIVAPGVDRNDAVVGDSSTSPVVYSADWTGN